MKGSRFYEILLPAEGPSAIFLYYERMDLRFDLKCFSVLPEQRFNSLEEGFYQQGKRLIFREGDLIGDKRAEIDCSFLSKEAL